MAPALFTQKAFIEGQLSGVLGTRVSIADLQGRWFRVGPLIDIQQLQIINAQDPTASTAISSLSLKPALFSSLFAGQMIIDQVVVQSPVIELVQADNGRWSLAGLAGGGGDYTDAIIDFLLNTALPEIRKRNNR